MTSGTPAMRLSAIKANYDTATQHDLERAFALGHEFGLQRAAEALNHCNLEGLYGAGAVARIRKLQVVIPTFDDQQNTVEKEF